MCKKTPAVTVIPENNITTDEKVENKVYIDISDDILSFGIEKPRSYFNDTDENKFIGYADFSGILPGILIKKLYLYEKYIVIDEVLFSDIDELWHEGFRVYEYNKDLKMTEYKKSGKILYDFVDTGPYYYEGIYNDLLFIDEGTGPDGRAIHIFDLANNEEIFAGTYSGSYSFNNNIVHNLTMSGVEYDDYDDEIKTRFYELKEGAKTPKDDNGLSTRFVVKYNYNVLTKEIDLLYGTYVFEQ
jgi:hypothetical protein